MLNQILRRRMTILKLLATLLVTMCIFMILIFPKEIIDTTRDALSLWANVVLPSLLPFFIGTELLIGLGVVSLIGVLLEPVMQKVFKVPGESSFAFVMSMTSGYPIGIKIANHLEKTNKINTNEAQRIASFASTAGPLFIFGAVSIGMFENPSVGYIIALGHYVGAILVGITLALFAKDTPFVSNNKEGKMNIFSSSIRAMLEARKMDGRTIGQLIRDAVVNSVNTLLMIGGIISLFSVLVKEIQLLGIPSLILSIIPNTTPFANELLDTIIYGITEMTIGCRSCSGATTFSLDFKIIITTMIISWSGFSIHTQAASVLRDSKISMSKYIYAKLLHTFYSGIICYILVLKTNIRPIVSAFFTFSDTTSLLSIDYINVFIYSSKSFILLTLTLITLGLLYRLIKS